MTGSRPQGSYTIVDRMPVPRRRCHRDAIRFGTGVDFGSDGVALVAVTDGTGRIVSMLTWFSGYRTPICGIRGFGNRYVPARLSIGWCQGFEDRTLHDGGGRLSRVLLDVHSAAIDGHFGTGTTERIDLRRTLLIADG